jgi:hypothetical protein
VALLLLPWWNAMFLLVPLTLLVCAGAVLNLGETLRVQRAALGHMARRRFGPRGSVLTTMRRMLRIRTTLGRAQRAVHRFNVVIMKVHALVTWQDPTRTRLFVMWLAGTGLWLLFVPLRVTFALLLLHQFTKVLRDPNPGVARLSLARFFDGLPLPSLATAAYASHPAEAAAAAPLGADVQVLRLRERTPRAPLG